MLRPTDAPTDAPIHQGLRLSAGFDLEPLVNGGPTVAQYATIGLRRIAI